MRSPSAFVRRIIGVWGLDDLFGSSRQEEPGGAGEALGHATQVATPGTVWPEQLGEIV